MFSKFFLFLTILLINTIYSYIVLPLKLLPKENYISNDSLNTQSDIMSKQFISSYFTELELGTPSQKIPMIIKPKINDYVITSSHPMINSTINYTRNVYELTDNFLKNYSYYDEKLSNSYSLVFCSKRKPYNYENDLDKPIAEQMCISNENFFLYDNIETKKKKEKKHLYFELVQNIKDNVTGILGLNLYDSNNQKSFLNVLKTQNIIENYTWFYDFDSWDSENGKVVLGAYPHYVYKDKYSEKDFLNTDAGVGFYYWEMKFDEIYVENKVDFNQSNEIVDLDSESNLIVGSNEYRKYLLSLIEELIKDNKCMNGIFKGYDELLAFSSDYEYFYCKNDKETKKKLDELISSIYFLSKDLQYTFELTKDQILMENGDYIYINIVFSNSYNWRLGKQISLKYKFVYNAEARKIGFYKKFKDKEKSSSKILIYLLIIFLCIIFCILGVFLGKYLYTQNKKKRANELKDDDYEYMPEGKNEKNKIVPENEND